MDMSSDTQATGQDWNTLDQKKFLDEDEVLSKLLARVPLDREARKLVKAEAESLVVGTRKAAKRQGVLESFLQEFGLANREGLALMCLAEALLRVPDEDTQDRLISEKIRSGDWESHLGHSDSMFVNASTWGLMLTGKVIDVDGEVRQNIGGFMRKMVSRLGEPMVRAAMLQAIRIMGEQFVLGRNMREALKRARTEKSMCSFDMLGEGARTHEDAERYAGAYMKAIEATAKATEGQGPEDGHGISVKLSALHPRYHDIKTDEVMAELYPRLLPLAEAAARANLNFCLDAEEADRLILQLKTLERLCHEPSLKNWTGLGLAVQAYQKRSPLIIEQVRQLAMASERRLMVRLVKGAYWDNEIKIAQIGGHPDYPVFTSKAATDVNYLDSAAKLLDASPHLYAQFATHNAHTLAAVRHMAKARNVPIEFQRLHGMGEPLYAALKDQGASEHVRVYAPVGEHEDLLPYLVRRLLENGANTSFVHALLDEKIPAAEVAHDPITSLEAAGGVRNPRIPAPSKLYGEERLNSKGVDITQARIRQRLQDAIAAFDALPTPVVTPLVNGEPVMVGKPTRSLSPTDRRRLIATVHEADLETVHKADQVARAAQPAWDAVGGSRRAAVLRAMGDALEANTNRLIAILAREAGKTLEDGVAEVREAVDFCRYYAHLAETQFGEPKRLPGPAGQTDHLELRGRGVFASISPWNFPLAIFTGQLAAALAAGNAVLVKPAEQTPLVAFEAVKLFYAAGLNPALLGFLPGPGETVGATLVKEAEVDGVSFTGSTEVARLINQTLAHRDGGVRNFIAETGGLNGMFVDTSALREQVVDDVILSAFGSAGQRCSALRILYLPAETADSLIHSLVGAMQALKLGDPVDPSVDVGPVIDEEARDRLLDYIENLKTKGMLHYQMEAKPWAEHGVFVPPTLVEIPSLEGIDREAFGPVLHVIRYKRSEIAKVCKELDDKGYGLTLGVHSRLNSFADEIMGRISAGNVYVNRSMIGAVVGVQPFGGDGLSGTGPKAGGPHSLLRYATERAVSVNIAAQGGDPELINLG